MYSSVFSIVIFPVKMLSSFLAFLKLFSQKIITLLFFFFPTQKFFVFLFFIFSTQKLYFHTLPIFFSLKNFLHCPFSSIFTKKQLHTLFTSLFILPPRSYKTQLTLVQHVQHHCREDQQRGDH